MATLRLDGFVAMVAGQDPGRLLTKPFVLEGANLYINAACELDGEVSVAVLDEETNILPGFGHKPCVPRRDDGIRLRVVWQENATLSTFRDRVVRLEFLIKQARVYSFWCQD